MFFCERELRIGYDGTKRNNRLTGVCEKDDKTSSDRSNILLESR